MTFLLRRFALRHWAILLVFLFLGGIFFGTVRDGHDWGGDFSIYISQARNFAEHRPFRQNTYVPTEDSMLHQPAAYPPITSLILAPVYLITDLNYRAFKYALIAFLWLSIPVYYALACSRGLHPIEAALIVLIFGLSPPVLSVKESVGSDNVFIFLAGATLLFLDAAYRRGWDEEHPFSAGAIAALLMMLCYLTRATGLTIIGAFAIYEVWRARRLRPFGITAIVLTAAAMAVYTKFIFHAGQQYGTHFPFQPRGYLDHAMFYLRTPAALWAPAPSIVRYTLAFATLSFSVVGAIWQLRRPTITEPYVILSIVVAVVYATHAPAEWRYVMALIPFLLIYAALGMEYVLSRLPLRDRSRRLIFAAAGVGAVLGTGFNLGAIETSTISDGIAQRGFVEVCSFLREQTPADALILSWNPRVFALYTDKPSALYPQSGTADDFESRIPRRGPVFLVDCNRSLDRLKLTPYLQQAGQRIHVVFENGDFRVYALPAGG
jgi:hypothetical protein